MRTLATIVALVLLASTGAQAEIVRVEATGIVIFNGIGASPLGDVSGAEDATMTFLVDSDMFMDGVPGDTRGYPIDMSSFSLSFSGGVDVGLLSPFPAGQTPYFTLVDGFPVSDGFFVSTNNVSPGGVPLSQEPVNFNLDLGYVGETLTSLEILDAVGVYDFDGLTRFGFNLWQVVPDNVVMDIDFSQLTIQVEEPSPTLESSWSGVKQVYR